MMTNFQEQQESRILSLKVQQERLIRNYEHDREYYAWIKLPPWEKYESDRTPEDYADWGEHKSHNQPAKEDYHTALTKDVIDLDKEGIPY